MKNIKLLILFLLFAARLVAQEDVNTLIQEGVELHEKGEFDAAINVYEKALKIDSKSAMALYEISYSYFAKGKYNKSIEYADRVIKYNQGHVKESMLIKGSALDNQGKSDKAIEIYEVAVEKFPYDYLLYYNLSLTYYGLKKNKEAEAALLATLELNPDHSSSHLLLAYLKINEGKRIQPLLALYTFLLLEPETQRAKDAYLLLRELLKHGVKKNDPKNIEINLGLNESSDEFNSAELLLSLKEAESQMKDSMEVNQMHFFIDQTSSLIEILSEQKEGQKGIWWEFYVDLLHRIKLSENLEAYCYYISLSSSAPEIGEWLEGNTEKLETFGKWLGE